MQTLLRRYGPAWAMAFFLVFFVTRIVQAQLEDIIKLQTESNTALLAHAAIVQQQSVDFKAVLLLLRQVCINTANDTQQLRECGR